MRLRVFVAGSSAKSLVEEVKEAVGSQTFNHWFEDGASIDVADQRVTIGVEDPFVHSWMQHRFRPAVTKAARRVLGETAEVRFMVRSEESNELNSERQDARSRAVANFIAAVASALENAHSKQIIHRDVKPSNVMIDVDAKPRLLDFGFTRQDKCDPIARPSEHTLRTPAYMSPEQALGSQERIDRATDVYALGAMLHEILTDQRPNEGKSQTVLHKGQSDEPARSQVVNKKIPIELETICRKAMDKEPARRYRTVRELADDLERWLLGGAILGQPRRGGIVSAGIATEDGKRMVVRGRRFADLNDFAAGLGTQLAFTAALQVCDQPGSYTPLVLHGGVGVGKTHLLEGIYRRMRACHPLLRVMFLSAESFANYFTQALRDRTLSGFRQRFRSVDVLLVDDVDFLDGKRVIQEEFLHTIQQLQSHGRQVALTADRHPRLLTRLSEELVSRFLSGIVCAMEYPDLDTRRVIVAKKALRLTARITHEATDYIVERFALSVRELEGALNLLDNYGQATGKTINLAIARQVLADLDRDCVRIVRVADVEQAVCHLFSIGTDELRSARRSRTLSQPRMLAMYLARKMTRAAYSQIGEHFGGRNHSTVISAEKRVRTLLAAGTTIWVGSQEWKLDDLVSSLEQQLISGESVNSSAARRRHKPCSVANDEHSFLPCVETSAEPRLLDGDKTADRFYRGQTDDPDGIAWVRAASKVDLLTMQELKENWNEHRRLMVERGVAAFFKRWLLHYEQPSSYRDTVK